MNQEIKPMYFILSIVESPNGKKLMDKLKSQNIKMHFQSVGYGTAPTEMMDIFGMVNNTKDIVMSFASESAIKAMMANFGNTFSSYSKYKGLMMVMKLSSINRLVAGILNHSAGDIQIEGGEKIMKNTHSHTLVMMSVTQGYSNEVMAKAKKYGATGGTIIHGRLAESEDLSELADVVLDDERELILILAPTKVGQDIMDNVNKEFGLKSKANGILWSVPVEKAYKI